MFCNLTQAKNHVSTPTWARTLAEATGQIIAQGRGEPVEYIQEKRGLYHLTDGGACTRYEWAKEILALDPNKEQQRTKTIKPAKSSDFPTKADRPMASLLNCDKLTYKFYMQLVIWNRALIMALINQK
jgi:dTDP-4-dehydrorhamnose reductase